MSGARLLSEDTIRQVASGNDIVQIVGERVPLKRTGTTFTGLCPFHQEKTPSLIITPARQSFKCFGCGAGGDVFKFISLADNIRFPDAVRSLAARAGIPIADDERPIATPMPTKPTRKPITPPRPVRTLRLPPSLHRGSRPELRAVAERRELSFAGVELASERGLLWFASPRGHPAWIVTDRTRINAQARRMDGETWPHIGDKKAYTLPGSRAPWPIGAREAAEFPFVALVEGGPDLLAAHHFIIEEGRERDVAAVAILGATNSIPVVALRVLTGKTVRIFPHIDSAGQGQDAAVRWAGQLERAGCSVGLFSFEGLRRANGKAVGDLNDFVCLDPASLAAERTDLERIMPQ